MALDRFVYWGSEVPTKEIIYQTLQCYLGMAVDEISIDDNRMTAVLVGAPSFPFRHIKGYEDFAAASEIHDERWFEVYYDSKYVDIITRMADEYTNVVADGFAALCARFWKARQSALAPLIRNRNSFRKDGSRLLVGCGLGGAAGSDEG